MNIIETQIHDYLVSNGIYPFSVLYIQELPLLKISFYLKDDIPEFIELTGGNKLCDNFGYRTFPDTILISGMYLTKILRDVGCS